MAGEHVHICSYSPDKAPAIAQFQAYISLYGGWYVITCHLREERSTDYVDNAPPTPPHPNDKVIPSYGYLKYY